MQGTTDCHHEITDTLLPQADPVLHQATAFDSAVDRLDAQPAVGQRLGGHVLRPCPLRAARWLGWPQDLDLGKRAREEAPILSPPPPGREGGGRGHGDTLIVHPPCRGRAEAEDREQGIDEQDMFARGGLLLAALTRGLCSRVLGADDAPCRAVMGTRGDAGPPAGAATRGVRSSSKGMTPVATSAAAPPRRWARAVSERAGASPRGRRGASRTGRRPGIHGVALLCLMRNSCPWTTWSAEVFP